MFWLALVSSLLDPLTLKLSETGFLSGTFVQTDTWALTRETEVSRGVMGIAHPNLFRLDYSTPPGRVTGCDGGSVYTIDPLYSEVVVYGDSGAEGFLHLLERADDEGMVTEEHTNGDEVAVTVTGDLGGGISSMEVRYNRSDSLPFYFSTSDVNGNLTVWSLSDLETAGEPPSGYFRMTVPAGYTTVSGDR